MKNKKIEVINPNRYEEFQRIPKSISINEKFEKTVAEKIEFADEKLEELIKSKRYQEAMEYKEDLLLKSKYRMVDKKD